MSSRPSKSGQRRSVRRAKSPASDISSTGKTFLDSEPDSESDIDDYPLPASSGKGKGKVEASGIPVPHVRESSKGKNPIPPSSGKAKTSVNTASGASEASKITTSSNLRALPKKSDAQWYFPGIQTGRRDWSYIPLDPTFTKRNPAYKLKKNEKPENLETETEKKDEKLFLPASKIPVSKQTATGSSKGKQPAESKQRIQTPDFYLPSIQTGKKDWSYIPTDTTYGKINRTYKTAADKTADDKTATNRKSDDKRDSSSKPGFSQDQINARYARLAAMYEPHPPTKKEPKAVKLEVFNPSKKRNADEFFGKIKVPVPETKALTYLPIMAINDAQIRQSKKQDLRASQEKKKQLLNQGRESPEPEDATTECSFYSAVENHEKLVTSTRIRESDNEDLVSTMKEAPSTRRPQASVPAKPQSSTVPETGEAQVDWRSKLNEELRSFRTELKKNVADASRASDGKLSKSGQQDIIRRIQNEYVLKHRQKAAERAALREDVQKQEVKKEVAQKDAFNVDMQVPQQKVPQKEIVPDAALMDAANEEADQEQGTRKEVAQKDVVKVEKQVLKQKVQQREIVPEAVAGPCQERTAPQTTDVTEDLSRHLEKIAIQALESAYNNTQKSTVEVPQESKKNDVAQKSTVEVSQQPEKNGTAQNPIFERLRQQDHNILKTSQFMDDITTRVRKSKQLFEDTKKKQAQLLSTKLVQQSTPETTTALMTEDLKKFTSEIENRLSERKRARESLATKKAEQMKQAQEAERADTEDIKQFIEDLDRRIQKTKQHVHKNTQSTNQDLVQPNRILILPSRGKAPYFPPPSRGISTSGAAPPSSKPIMSLDFSGLTRAMQEVHFPTTKKEKDVSGPGSPPQPTIGVLTNSVVDKEEEDYVHPGVTFTDTESEDDGMAVKERVSVTTTNRVGKAPTRPLPRAASTLSLDSEDSGFDVMDRITILPSVGVGKIPTIPLPRAPSTLSLDSEDSEIAVKERVSVTPGNRVGKAPTLPLPRAPSTISLSSSSTIPESVTGMVFAPTPPMPVTPCLRPLPESITLLAKKASRIGVGEWEFVKGEEKKSSKKESLKNDSSKNALSNQVPRKKELFMRDSSTKQPAAQIPLPIESDDDFDNMSDIKQAYATVPVRNNGAQGSKNDDWCPPRPFCATNGKMILEPHQKYMESKVERVKGPLRTTAMGNIVSEKTGDFIELDTQAFVPQKCDSRIKGDPKNRVAPPIGTLAEAKNGDVGLTNPRSRKALARVVKNWLTGSSRAPKDDDEEMSNKKTNGKVARK